jgi:hypothetical protein
MSPKILGLSRKDLSIIALNANKGREIYAAFMKKDSGPVTYEGLDKVFKLWVEDKSVTKVENEEMANAFGCLFGEMLKKDFGFEWQLIEDHLGTEKALIDEKTGSVVYPINTVWKRIEPDLITEPFFKPMHDAIKQHLESISK